MNSVPPSKDSPQYKFTNRRVITKRGVLWLGLTCNLRCHFCYWLNRIESKDHPERPFMTIEKAKKICSILVEYYSNNAIDIQGGEPTLYKNVYELVRYCSDIGLLPSLITNGILLSNKEKCRRFKESGIRDFLISVQGLGNIYDEIVGGISGASKKQLQGIDNCVELGIPLRFNCTLTKRILLQLSDITKLAIEKNVRVVNFITFNPFEDQGKKGRRNIDNVPTYSEAAIALNNAMDILEDARIECNVRYFPICLVSEKHRKSVYNYQQMSYDLHEWDYASWAWTGIQTQRMKTGDITPPFSLEYATYGRYTIDTRLRKIKAPLESILDNYPRIVTPVLKMYHTGSKLLFQIFSKKNGAKENVEEIYRLNGRLRAQKHCYYSYSIKCDLCSIRDICDGFHGDYAHIFGTEEAAPITDSPQISDPIFFIKNQYKVVESEDFDWAL